MKDSARVLHRVSPAWHPLKGFKFKFVRSYDFFGAEKIQVSDLLTAECYPVTVAPGASRLFVDFCASDAATKPFYASLPSDEKWRTAPAVAPHRPELVRLLAAQNPSPAAAPALAALKDGAGTMLTGQQVGLFGGPLYSPLKAVTAIARARQAAAGGNPHVAVFWLATEDHDFAEINHIALPAQKELQHLAYEKTPEWPVPAGHVVLDESIVPLVERAAELLGPSAATDALVTAYRPGRTFGQAFAEFFARIFAAQGLLIVDPSGRDFHRLGAPVLQAGIERVDELQAALLERSRALEAAGYHTQVLVTEQSSLLFVIDEKTGARVALKRTAPTAAEPKGLWSAAGPSGTRTYSTEELLGILEAEPERISPAALLRPLFQDFIFGSSAQIGGPAEIAYLAQTSVLFDRILGRQTPVLPRFSATLIEPSVGKLLRKHELGLEQVFSENAATLAQRLAARSMPIETKQKLAAAGNAADEELTLLVEWMQSQDQGLGQSAETAAGKIRYQLGRLRTLAANFQLQRESTLTRHAETIAQALFPDGVLQERVHGGAYYFAHFGLELAETLCEQAANECMGHTAVWL